MPDDPTSPLPKQPGQPRVVRPTSDPPAGSTEPLSPPPRFGGTPPLRPSARARRRPGMAIPGGLLGLAIAALIVAFLIGFFIGNLGDGEPAAEPTGEGGGGRACGRALLVALEVVELQRQAIANRAEFTAAALSGDEEQLLTLNQAFEPISVQVDEAQVRLESAAERCRSRQGGGGGGGGKGGGKNQGNGGGGNGGQ